MYCFKTQSYYARIKGMPAGVQARCWKKIKWVQIQFYGCRKSINMRLCYYDNKVFGRVTPSLTPPRILNQPTVSVSKLRCFQVIGDQNTVYIQERYFSKFEGSRSVRILLIRGSQAEFIGLLRTREKFLKLRNSSAF